MKRFVTTLLLLTASATILQAQAKHIQVRVTDVQGRAIPFAFVQIENGASRVANDSGRVEFNTPAPDSIRLQVRRMGFSPFIGWADKDSVTGEFVADLIPLPRALDAMTVEGRRDTPLARRGFYDRMERVQRGAYSARMITPEELDARNPMTISQMLSGERFVKVMPQGGKPVLMSRNPGCAMTILLDGHRATGTLEEGVGFGPKPPVGLLMSVDELVTAHSVAAIEIYGSMASAPVELQRAAGNSGGCGLVALWTGSRR
ncbi:MAG TPA: carboxypeptidase-like regulatory domain-containing protein [Gemmatimonadaceae bacterium]|nr:carboxypeptidase-like regulatory domain-containing protein [Gemmatimonadaceae bacterium]